MKKTKIAVLAIAVIALCIGIAFASSATASVRRKQALSWDDEPWDSFASVVAKRSEAADREEATFEIPVYSEEDLFFDINNKFFLGRDAGVYAYFNSRPNDAGALFAAFPTDAMRLDDSGRVYTIYDSDSGYRLFLFFNKSNDYTIPVGFPVVIQKVHSYSDFSGLEIGSPIELVEEIDPAATPYRKLFIDVWEINPAGAEGGAKYGDPCTTIHYLSDGILKITYLMPEEGQLVISGMEYSEDYVMTDVLGNDIDYSILPQDLPQN